MKQVIFFFLSLQCLPAALWAAPVADSAGVRVVADARLSILFAHRPEQGYQSLRGAIHAARGYRVQIYNGSDRSLAQQRKQDFMRRFPGQRAYLSYVAPTYRLKVGDFKSREEAARLYRQLAPLYAPCMIVPDLVVLNTLRHEY